jgi:hypothetical protein
LTHLPDTNGGRHHAVWVRVVITFVSLWLALLMSYQAANYVHHAKSEHHGVDYLVHPKNCTRPTKGGDV